MRPITFTGAREMSDSSEGGGLKGILIFVLIFGVGNLILYLTTGFVIIPIK